jgi:chromate transporter
MLAAVCGNVLPSVVIVISLCTALNLVKNNPIVEAALLGIRPAVVGLIAYAAFNMAKTSLKDSFAFILCVTALAISIFAPAVGIIPIIFLGGIAGVASRAFRKIKFAKGS